MFWDLKGATDKPSSLNILQSPAARKLFPALDMVPCTMITRLIGYLLSVLHHPATARTNTAARAAAQAVPYMRRQALGMSSASTGLLSSPMVFFL